MLPELLLVPVIVCASLFLVWFLGILRKVSSWQENENVCACGGGTEETAELFPRAGCWSEEESDESLGNEIEKEWIP